MMTKRQAAKTFERRKKADFHDTKNNCKNWKGNTQPDAAKIQESED